MSIKPLHPLVATMVAKLNSDLREDFEERAAIMEFDSGIDRAMAEALALLCVLHNHPTCLQPWLALEVRLSGERRHILTLDPEDTRLRLEAMGGTVVAIVDPMELIRSEFHGAALLRDL